MRGTEHIGISGIGFFHRHFVVKPVGDQVFGHFFAPAQFVDELLVQPRFVDFERGVGQQAIAVEAFDIVAFIGAAVAPDVYVVLFHGGDQRGARYGAPERGGVEIRHAAGGNMERAALDGSDALAGKLSAAVNQAGVFRAVFHGFLRDGGIVVFVGLPEVGGVGIGVAAFQFYPQQRGGGVQPARKGDADFLPDGKGLENSRGLAHFDSFEVIGCGIIR